MTKPATEGFSAYQLKLIICLAALLFTVVLDFMLLPALSALILPALDLSTTEFGYVVSAYSFAAGSSALLFSAFADGFERKKLLLSLYSGFLLGILASALAHNFWMLILARAFTGIFGGLIAAICFSMVSEVFSLNQKGRAMSIVQMAFAFSQILGLPAALYLASSLNWQSAYFVILGFGLVVMIFSLFGIKPLKNHLQKRESAWKHIYQSVQKKPYWLVFSNNALVVTGDVLFTTFVSAYFVGNQGISEDQLAWVFGASGLATLVFSPIIGRLADRFSHYKVFLAGSLLSILMVISISLVEDVGITGVIILNTLLFIGVTARMICSGALGLEMPDTNDRGTFLTFDSALQQICAGLAASVAGWIVIKGPEGMVEHYPRLALIVSLCIIATLILTARIAKKVRAKQVPSI